METGERGQGGRHRDLWQLRQPANARRGRRGAGTCVEGTAGTEAAGVYGASLGDRLGRITADGEREAGSAGAAGTGLQRIVELSSAPHPGGGDAVRPVRGGIGPRARRRGRRLFRAGRSFVNGGAADRTHAPPWVSGGCANVIHAPERDGGRGDYRCTKNGD